MVEFDKDGYLADAPVKPERWQSVFGDVPPGRFIVNNAVPPGVLVIQNFLDPRYCDALVAECRNTTGQVHTTGVLEGGGDFKTAKSEYRKSEMVDIRDLKSDIVGLVRQIYSSVVGPHFNAQIEWFELPEILRYGPGGEYIRHADADNWSPDEKKWTRVIDRDLSILLYLNEDFEGGELVFPNFEFGLQPKRGLLIAFPSDRRFMHAAKPVKSGERLALVSWAAVRGGVRVNKAPPADIFQV